MVMAGCEAPGLAGGDASSVNLCGGESGNFGDVQVSIAGTLPVLACPLYPLGADSILTLLLDGARVAGASWGGDASCGRILGAGMALVLKAEGCCCSILVGDKGREGVGCPWVDEMPVLGRPGTNLELLEPAEGGPEDMGVGLEEISGVPLA